jgi:hypothetical protein
MEFEFWPAVTAGLLGGIAMSVLMNGMRAAGKTDMDMELMEGTMLSGRHSTARVLGVMMHLVMMSALVFGSLYALLFAWVDPDPESLWWVGAAFGVVHGMVAGMAMGMMPMMHPRMVRDPMMAASVAAPSRPGSPVLTAEPDLKLRPPGLFARNYGSMTPAGELMAHVTYGLVVGLVYWWLAV